MSKSSMAGYWQKKTHLNESHTPALLFAPLAMLQAADDREAVENLLKPPELWKDYDPNQGDFKEEIVKQETLDGVYHRDEPTVWLGVQYGGGK